MIKSKKQFKEYCLSDNNWLLPKSAKQKFLYHFTNPHYKYIKKYLKYLRKQELHLNSSKKNIIQNFLSLYYERKKNKLGVFIGVEISPNCFGKGLSIYHGGNIVVNPAVKVGDNCILHGGNCIGNNGLINAVPKIGNNVDIGFGAVIIGDIQIADNIKIGANALVNKSFFEEGCTIAGVPAKIIKKF